MPEDIQQIESSSGAFAAIRADGLVVTWGQADAGGPSGNLKDIYSCCIMMC